MCGFAPNMPATRLFMHNTRSSLHNARAYQITDPRLHIYITYMHAYVCMYEHVYLYIGRPWVSIVKSKLLKQYAMNDSILYFKLSRSYLFNKTIL